ncbi:hypothetical protein WJX72_010097 [[Myrmecia] bisecta]|uniref:GHMP kinase N-terminal domain-containing protein n=1 Tax=[Myrmecia] bisecta TaxID=41462 RepID=A0AAW1P506_9CHLO
MTVVSTPTGVASDPCSKVEGSQQDDAHLELFVPGRLCLFGEHSDWAGSYRRLNEDIPPGRAIVVGTEQGLYARVSLLAEPMLIMTATTDTGEVEGPHAFPLTDAQTLVRVAAQRGFWSYIAGVAYKIVTEHHVEGGLRIDNYRTTLPLKKGLSSSAAVCVLVARAFNRMYGLKLTTRGEMEYAYSGERMTPSLCGRMDQANAFGSVPVVLTFDGDALHVDSMHLGAALPLVLVDLRAAKDTVMILAQLQAGYPAPDLPEHQELHDLLGHTNQRITMQAMQLMRQGNAEKLGALMTEAQRAFDEKAGPCCPAQLRAPVLHKVLSYERIQPLIWGGKGVGSQGDGTAQLLCRSEEAQAQLLQRCRVTAR